MKMGRRKVLLFISLPFGMSWLMTAFADSVMLLYVTSLTAGFLTAIVTMVTQVYISEITLPEVRGRLSSLSKILNQIGILISFSVGAYLNWQKLALVVAIAPTLLFIAVIKLPETPSFLLLKGKDEEAAESLQWLRGPDTDTRQELATIRTNILASKQFSDTDRHPIKVLLSKRLMGPVLITCGLMLFQRFSGAHAFNFYAVSTFAKAFGSVSPHIGAIVMSTLQMFASCLSGLLIDKIGRLPLLLCSGVMMSLALAGFGSYIYYLNLVKMNHGVVPGDWIPMLCVVVFTVAFSLGISPISWLLIGELFPLEYRSLGSSLATTFSYLCAFIGVKTFVDFQEALGLDGTFWLYSAISILGLCFVVVCVPETKGRKMDEMDPKYIESLCINR
ncbi:facilitated trehalose transporter Tret1-like [Arctopsyche grandis]|uniref:facilitated trehalose transporter Tret1-like n=1 Tax=Arctopsyche grandis TaxID=121162 RepID=UPI00406D6BAB